MSKNFVGRFYAPPFLIVAISLAVFSFPFFAHAAQLSFSVSVGNAGQLHVPQPFIPDTSLQISAADFYASCFDNCTLQNDTVIKIYDSDGTTLLATSNPFLLDYDQFQVGFSVHASFSGNNKVILSANHIYFFTLFLVRGTAANFYSNQDVILSGDSVVKEPIIIVPGVMGSRLNRVNDGVEVWPDSLNMAKLGPDDYLDELKLDSFAKEIVGHEMNPTSIIDEEFAFGFSLGTFYRPIIDNFIHQGYVASSSFFVVPYDWRLDVRTNVSKLADVIAQARAHSPNGKVSVVAHSMGGLLTKAYLSEVADTSFVDKLIFLGVPHLGSLKAFKALNYGDSMGLLKYGFLGLNSDEVKDMSQNMPGVHQLLPGREYFARNPQIPGGPLGTGYVLDFRNGNRKNLNYDEANQFMAQQGRNPNMLALSDSYHLQSDSADVHIASTTKFYTIAGCQRNDTIGAFKLYDNGEYGLEIVDGDGTVPLLSANSFSNATGRYYALAGETGVDHTGLVQQTSTLGLMNNLLEGNGIIPAGTSADVLDCVGSGSSFLISSHSPVRLHVYDSHGHHTGPKENGDMEFGIPDSSYEVIEHNSFVFVPVGDTYRVELEATDRGSFDLHIDTLAGTQVKSKTTYINVPLQSTSTHATLTLSDSQPTPDLQLDSDGNGTPDATLAPSSILYGDASTDSEPPILTMPSVPFQVIEGATTTFVFGAQDAGSGVAAVLAMLNGINVTNGQTVAFTAPGDNVFRLQATDNAGNPSVQEVHFTVRAIKQAALISVADAYVDRGHPNRNYGGERTMRVSAEGDNRSLIAFDQEGIKSIIANGTLLSATLQIKIARNGTNWGREGRNLDLHRLTRAWTESGATWECPNDTDINNNMANCRGSSWEMDKPGWGVINPWTTTSTDSIVITSSTRGTIEYDVTNDVANFLAGIYVNSGWLIKKHQENKSGFVEFSSRESSSSPKLVLRYAQ